MAQKQSNATTAEKIKFRKLKNEYNEIYSKLSKVEETWIDLETQRLELLERLTEKLEELKQHCIHPRSYLTEISDRVHQCRICNTKIQIVKHENKKKTKRKKKD